MARAMSLSATRVQRIRGAFGLQRHWSESSKLSGDPPFVDKVHDLARLYLDPPERAPALCVGETSRIQARDRMQPPLPMRAGQAERHTHDNKCHGTTTLFVESNLPAGLDIHVVMDNASSHKTKLFQDWFAKRPHWHRHFTPTSASWISQV